MTIKHQDRQEVVNQGGDYNAAGHDWRWYVVEYNAVCKGVEKWILFYELVITSGSPRVPGPRVHCYTNLIKCSCTNSSGCLECCFSL